MTFLRPFGESIEEHQVRDPDYGQIFAFEACLSEGGFRFRAQNPDGWFPERRFPQGAPADDAPRATLCLRTVDYNEDGVVAAQSTHAGWTLLPRSLAGPGRSIPLSPRGRGAPRSVIIDSTETRAIAISHMTDDEGVLRNRVERINIETGDAERLSAGHGFASARFGTDGALYVDARGVLRFDADSAEPQTTLRGLSLF
ncbi:MAG: hypothetical protein AB8H86_33255 [Polyangiales bacterium]